MWKGVAALAGVPCAGVTLWLLLPGPITPHAWTPAMTVGPAGAFAVNEELRRVERLPLVRADRLPAALGTAPEAAALCEDGGLYTGLEGGSVVRLDLPAGTPHEVVKTGGRPLGLACHHDMLYIADSERGLLRWSRDKGLERIATCPGDQPYFTDGVAVEKTGLVWFSCPSERWTFRDVRLDTLEGQPTGRLMTWDPTTGATTEKLSGLRRVEREHRSIIGICPRRAVIRCFRHAANRSGERLESRAMGDGNVPRR